MSVRTSMMDSTKGKSTMLNRDGLCRLGMASVLGLMNWSGWDEMKWAGGQDI